MTPMDYADYLRKFLEKKKTKKQCEEQLEICIELLEDLHYFVRQVRLEKEFKNYNETTQLEKKHGWK